MTFELPNNKHLPILILFLSLFVIMSMIIMFNSFVSALPPPRPSNTIYTQLQKNHIA